MRGAWIRLRAGQDEPSASGDELDLAGAWTFAEGRQRALSAFAAGLERAAKDPSVVFLAGQAALYASVEREDSAFFERIAEASRAGNIDVGVAALWAETDCNIPSGESLLRQLVLGCAYVHARFGVAPSVAWFAGSSALPNTLPQLLSHAGLRFCALGTPVPHSRFVWRGPDDSSVVAATIEGAAGGARWFEAAALQAHPLPRVNGELDDCVRRGVWTSRHDVKARRFAIEAALDESEELCAWTLAVRSPRTMTTQLANDLRGAWPIFLRCDARRVIEGTSIDGVYGELDEDYARVERILDRVRESAYSILPRGELSQRDEREIPPREDEGTFVFENERISARVRSDGTVVELRKQGGESVVTGANVLRVYTDSPKGGEAANLDPRYEKKPRRIRFKGSSVEDDALVARYRVGRSTIVLRISLGVGDPYLRCDAAVLWEERNTLLRLEHWLAVETPNATFGTPHGTVERPALGAEDANPAAFEVPAQRFARVDGPHGGFAVLAGDVYGWNARALKRGGIHLGLSLLRGPVPGEHRFAYALLPLEPGAGLGAIEQVWRGFAYPPRVRLFGSDDPAVLVVACKPADDGDGAIVRVRECDGAARMLRLRCGGRIREVESSDARERRIERAAEIEDYAIVASLGPYELRTFRVRF